MSEHKVAILGGGRIGEALLSGLLSSGWRNPSEVVVTDRRDERNAELNERYGVEATTDNAAAGRSGGGVGPRQAAGHRRPARPGRPAPHVRTDPRLGRGRDHDRAHRG